MIRLDTGLSGTRPGSSVLKMQTVIALGGLPMIGLSFRAAEFPRKQLQTRSTDTANAVAAIIVEWAGSLQSHPTWVLRTKSV